VLLTKHSLVFHLLSRNTGALIKPLKDPAQVCRPSTGYRGQAAAASHTTPATMAFPISRQSVGVKFRKLVFALSLPLTACVIL